MVISRTGHLPMIQLAKGRLKPSIKNIWIHWQIKPNITDYNWQISAIQIETFCLNPLHNGPKNQISTNILKYWQKIKQLLIIGKYRLFKLKAFVFRRSPLTQ